MSDRERRTTNEVIAEHLRNRRAGRLMTDLEVNYTEDVVVMSHLGHFQGREAVDALATLLQQQLKDADFFYNTAFVDSEFAFLQWTAHGKDLHVSDGADSFVVRDGRICMQTIYYSLSTNPEAENAPAGNVED